MTPDNKRIAKYAAVGALIAIPVPIIGIPVGALVGAVLGYRKNQRLAGNY
jgi:uncharacterized membrane protein